MTPSVDSALTGDGSVFVFPFGDPSVSMPRAVRFPIHTLSGETVDIELPLGWATRGVTRSINVNSGKRGIGWQTTTRGFALWNTIADLPEAALVDLIEIGGAILAQYRLSSDPNEPRMTLWQGEYFDLFTYNLADVEDAIVQLSDLRPTETETGVVLDLSNWWVETEELLASLITPRDSDGHSLLMEVRSLVQHPEDRPAVPGDKGRSGDFYLIGESVTEGLLFVTDTASVTITPMTESGAILRDSESFLMEDLNAVWRNDISRASSGSIGSAVS